MPELYDELRNADRSRRLQITEHLIQEMRVGHTLVAGQTYGHLCERVIVENSLYDSRSRRSRTPGVYSASQSAALVYGRQRVSGFLEAIANAPSAGLILDAGCGSSAILSVGAAIYHPEAKVFAYEKNRKAARCAKILVNLMGLSDRIDVRAKDIMTAHLPTVDLAMTETFNAGLQLEKGQEITERLARIAQEILPATIVMRASDELSNSEAWQVAAVLDLSARNEFVYGQFRSTGSGRRNVHVHAAYFDARGNPIITDPNADNISSPIPLGSVNVTNIGTPIYFSYRLGVNPPQSQTILQVA